MENTDKMSGSTKTEEKSNYIDDITSQLVQVDECITKLETKMADATDESDKTRCHTQIDGLKMKKYRLQEMLDMQKKGGNTESAETTKTNIQTLWNELKESVSAFTENFKSNK